MTKLFKFFAAKYVSIIMKSVKGSQQLGDGQVIEGNVILEGYLLDGGLLKIRHREKEDVIRIFVGDDKEVFVEFDVDDDGGRH